MGLFLTPLVNKVPVRLADLEGKTLAVDGNGMLYDLMAMFRKPDGSLLTDPEGNVTSHLRGLVDASTRLITDFGIRLVFVFDGEPPALKREELERRRAVKERFAMEYEEARKAGLMEVAFSKALRAARVTQSMVADAERLLDLLGIPRVRAPSEGEAQAAFMAKNGDAWAVASKDYDTLLFGSPRMVRLVYRSPRDVSSHDGPISPPTALVIDLSAMLATHRITPAQLIDAAILIGNDFNHGIRGMGPKSAVSLIKSYGNIERLPPHIKPRVSENYREVREFFLHPPVTDRYRIEYGAMDEAGLLDFLRRDKGFPCEYVEKAIERMKGAKERRKDL